MAVFLRIGVLLLQNPVGHLKHELHIRAGHLAGPVEQQAEARILMEGLQALIVVVVVLQQVERGYLPDP